MLLVVARMHPLSSNTSEVSIYKRFYHADRKPDNPQTKKRASTSTWIIHGITTISLLSDGDPSRDKNKMS